MEPEDFSEVKKLIIKRAKYQSQLDYARFVSHRFDEIEIWQSKINETNEALKKYYRRNVSA